MGARELLADLTAAGVSVSLEGGRVIVRPASLLTDGLREAIRAEKPALVDLLAKPMPPVAERVIAAEPGPVDLAASAWTDADIAKLNGRRVWLMRRGWAESDAEKLAERLVKRDREGDDRRICLECTYLTRAGRCLAASIGRLAGRTHHLEPMVTMLQRCEGFAPDQRG